MDGMCARRRSGKAHPNPPPAGREPKHAGGSTVACIHACMLANAPITPCLLPGDTLEINGFPVLRPSDPAKIRACPHHRVRAHHPPPVSPIGANRVFVGIHALASPSCGVMGGAHPRTGNPLVSIVPTRRQEGIALAEPHRARWQGREARSSQSHPILSACFQVTRLKSRILQCPQASCHQCHVSRTRQRAPASERKMHALLAYANIWMQHHARNPASCGAQTDPHAAEPKPIRERDWSDMERRRCRRCPQPATPSTLPCLLPGDTPENIALQRVSGSWFSRFPGVHRHRLQWTSPALVIAVLGSIS